MRWVAASESSSSEGRGDKARWLPCGQSGAARASGLNTQQHPTFTLQDGISEEGGMAAVAATAASAASPSSAPPGGAAVKQEWGDVVLPALVGVLQQRRGQHLQESKEAAAGVLAKFAANGASYAAAVG